MALGSVVALAGGVGGAKMAQGIAQMINPGKLTVVVNTADDFEHLGLHISPDLDTVMYTLAGLHNAATGWGLADESWSFMEALGRLGGATSGASTRPRWGRRKRRRTPPSWAGF